MTQMTQKKVIVSKYIVVEDCKQCSVLAYRGCDENIKFFQRGFMFILWSFRVLVPANLQHIFLKCHGLFSPRKGWEGEEKYTH